VITDQEMAWVTSHQGSFSRAEEATAIRLGRLVDEGMINPGCRIPSRLLQHRQVANDWIEPVVLPQASTRDHLNGSDSESTDSARNRQKETLENPSCPRDKGVVIAGQDRGDGR
jgi:hypothetical protein